MDSQFWELLFKILIFLPFILALVFLSLKLGGNKLQEIRNGRYMKVLEKISLTKDTSLLVVQIGKKGFVLSASMQKTEILFELSQDEIEALRAENPNPDFHSIKKWIEKMSKKEEEHE